jgi:hypothetical protein
MSIAKVRGVVVLALVACALAAGVTALAFAAREPKVEARATGRSRPGRWKPSP